MTYICFHSSQRKPFMVAGRFLAGQSAARADGCAADPKVWRANNKETCWVKWHVGSLHQSSPQVAWAQATLTRKQSPSLLMRANAVRNQGIFDFQVSFLSPGQNAAAGDWVQGRTAKPNLPRGCSPLQVLSPCPCRSCALACYPDFPKQSKASKTLRLERMLHLQNDDLAAVLGPYELLAQGVAW